MSNADKVSEIKGTITLADGSTSEFRIGTDFGWAQWGAVQARLGRTVDVLDAIVAGVQEAEISWASDYDEDEDE